MAAETIAQSLDDLASALQTDRLIKLHIGNQERPYNIQQLFLVNCSEYFAKALRDNQFAEARSGTFRLLEDREDTWKVLLYWMTHRELPGDYIKNDLLLAVRCWILGDKYDIKLFQDDVMLMMISYGAETSSDPTPEMVREVFYNTPPGSKLRDFITEESVYLFEPGVRSDRLGDAVLRKNIGELDETGFLPLYTEKKREYNAQGGDPDWCDRFRDGCWKRYLRGPAERYQGWALDTADCMRE